MPVTAKVFPTVELGTGAETVTLAESGSVDDATGVAVIEGVVVLIGTFDDVF